MKLSIKYMTALALLLLGVAGTATIGGGLFQSPPSTPLRIPFDQFPKSVGGWTMVNEVPLTKGELAFIQPDAHLRRLYQKGNQAVWMYMAFYGNRYEGQKRIHHNSTVCMPASGFTAEDVSDRGGNSKVVFQDIAKQIPLSNNYFTKGGSDVFVTQFFSVDGTLFDEAPRPKLTPFKRLTERFEALSSAGYCFQVQISHSPHGDIHAAEELHLAFLRDTIGQILRHFPAQVDH